MSTVLRAVVGFALAAAVLGGAMGWVTRRTLELERAERQAVTRTSWEEDIRLSLWRMDATLATWLALENARSPGAFLDDPEAPAAGGSAGAVPAADLPRARFELRPGGVFLARPGVERPPWADRLSRELPAITQGPPGSLAAGGPGGPPGSSRPGDPARRSAASQSLMNVQEFDKRQILARQSAGLETVPADPRVLSPLAASWIDGELLLTRRVLRSEVEVTQGAWLEWAAVRRWLLPEARELLPGAELVPIGPAAGPPDPGRQLALLPVALDPGPPPPAPAPMWTPVRLTLAIAWLALLLALAGIAVLLWRALALAQRRAEFVSAVTHELRTPLTSFRLFTDLLLDEETGAGERRAHLETLRHEASRLAHLVENVLAFSRLERRPVARPAESLPLPALLEQVLPALEERAGQSALALETLTAVEPREWRVHADAARTGQILLNLVDNACKYAGDGDPRRLVLEIDGDTDRLLFRLRDFGPGVARESRRRLFRPFHRAAEHAAGSAPGIGLGLALGRRLARSLGGDLALLDSEGGAVFELRLPATRRGSSGAGEEA